MTTRTAVTLAYIKAFITTHGYAPTRREIGKALGLSTSVVSYHLGLLQEAGKLTVARDIARGIVLTGEADANI